MGRMGLPAATLMAGLLLLAGVAPASADCATIFHPLERIADARGTTFTGTVIGAGDLGITFAVDRVHAGRAAPTQRVRTDGCHPITLTYRARRSEPLHVATFEDGRRYLVSTADVRGAYAFNTVVYVQEPDGSWSQRRIEGTPGALRPTMSMAGLLDLLVPGGLPATATVGSGPVTPPAVSLALVLAFVIALVISGVTMARRSMPRPGSGGDPGN